jgi:hypothetical protein
MVDHPEATKRVGQLLKYQQRITRLTGWRLHYRLPFVMSGSKGAPNSVLLHPECRDKVRRLYHSVPQPRLP